MFGSENKNFKNTQKLHLSEFKIFNLFEPRLSFNFIRI